MAAVVVGAVGSVGNAERCPILWATVGCPQGGTFDSAATGRGGGSGAAGVLL